VLRKLAFRAERVAARTARLTNGEVLMSMSVVRLLTANEAVAMRVSRCPELRWCCAKCAARDSNPEPAD